MGRPRLPDQLKVLKGTWRDDRADPERLTVEPCRIPAAPRELAEDERRIWADLRRILQPLGIVGETDLLAFRLMVRAFARAFRKLDDPAADPTAAIKQAQGLAREFGLTPSSRSTIRAAAGEEAERTLDDFLRAN